jgi:hypothetical protein
MRITGKQLRQIIKEEVARSVVNEKRAVLQERKPIRVYSDRLRQVVEKVYDVFSDAYDFQLNVASLSLQIEQTIGLERNEALVSKLAAYHASNSDDLYSRHTLGAMLVLGVDAAPGPMPDVSLDTGLIRINGEIVRGKFLDFGEPMVSLGMLGQMVEDLVKS